MSKTGLSLFAATMFMLTWGCGSVTQRPALPERYAEVTVPAGTTLSLTLDSEVASDISQVEGPVRARIERPVMVDGILAIPKGSMALGIVIAVDASGKVQGRAKLAFRFDQLNIDNHRYEIRSDTVSYQAEATKTEDAKKIGIGAGAGAVIGGLLGGKKGAGTGAVLGLLQDARCDSPQGVLHGLAVTDR